MILDTIEREFTRELAGLASPWPTLPGTLDDVLSHIRRSPDAALGVLLAALAGGDALAGRVVVRSFVPKLRLLARDGVDEDTLVASFWEVMARYPLERRPARIAANLVLDARKQAWADRGREVPVGLMPGGGTTADDVEDIRAADVLRRVGELRLVSADTLALLDDVYRRGLPGRAVARRRGLSEAAVRQRCSKAVRTMAAHRRELLAA